MWEPIRKIVVSLKRKPHTIPLLILVVAFIWYSFNLTMISNTTARVNITGMGLCGFITMLFSMLGIVSFNNSFPHRKPVNKVMLVIMFLMYAAVIAADSVYSGLINQALTSTTNPITVTADTIYITNSVAMLRTHMILLVIGLAATALLPVYAPMIRRIKTTVKVADNENMGKIDISGEDA